MKKRLVSKFLMGALVVLTMGVFSSCKDYDDDINANTAMINDLQSQVDALKQARQNLENELATAKTAIANAQNDASEALRRIAQAEADLKTAQATADEALAKAAQGIIDAENARLLAVAAQQAADEAKAAAAQVKIDLLKDLETKTAELNAAIALKLDKAEFEKVLETLATKEGLEAALQPITAGIAELRQQLADNAAADATLKQQVETISAKLDELYADAVRKGEFNTAIATLTTKIEGVDSKYNTLITNLTQRIADEEANRAAAITALQNAIMQTLTNYATLEYVDGQIGTLDGKIAEIVEKMATKEALSEAVANLMILIDQKADKSALEQAVAELTAAIAEKADNAEFQTVKQTLANVAGLVAEIYADYVKGEDLDALKNELQTWVNGLGFQTEEDVNALIAANNILIEAEIAAAVGPLETLIGTVDAKVDSKYAELNQKYESLLSTIEKLATKEYVDGQIGTITSTMNAISATVNNNLVPDVNNLKAEFAALQASLDEIYSDLDWVLELPAGSRFGANAAANSNTLASVLKVMAQKINDLYTYVNGTMAAVNEKLNVLTVFVNKNVTSLVTKPDYWTYGFPTIEATIIQPQPTYAFDEFAWDNKKSLKDLDDTWSYEGTATPNDAAPLSGYAFELTANYWVNPSCVTKAKLRDEYTYSFDEIAAKNYITRGNQDEQKAVPTDVKFKEYKNGVLTVSFKFENGENVNDALTLEDENGKLYAWTTTLALQAKRVNVEGENELGLKDSRIVTSDYAIVAPTYLNDLLLGNNKYNTKGHKTEGNQKYHLNTTYAKAVADDENGLYSFEYERDQTEALDFNKYVNVHYNGCTKANGGGVWSNKTAQNKGFTFVYTLLTNPEIWNLDGSELTIKEGQNISANTGFEKAAIVRVELQADGKTYAYGYLTVLMVNKNIPLEVDLDLVLQCDDEEDQQGTLFNAEYSWADLMKKINKAVNGDENVEFDWTLANFVVEDGTVGSGDKAVDGPYFKFKEESAASKEADDKVGSILHEGDNFVWQFTTEDALAAFYKDGKPSFYDEDGKATDFSTYVKILQTEKGNQQGAAAILIKVTIKSVTYPEGEAPMDYRIYSLWYKFNTAQTQTDATLRQEIHANVEVYGQQGNDMYPLDLLETQVADDEFVVRVSDAFYNNKNEDVNVFILTPRNGFHFKDNAEEDFLYGSLFFDASKYYVYNAADEGKDIKTVLAGSDKLQTTFATGASGIEYALFLTEGYTTLMAFQANDAGVIKVDLANAQEVVELGADYNREAKFFGRKDPTYEFARDLLNHTSHLNLGVGETFTTHMLLNDPEYCLPIDLINNRFDIRWLRPITGKLNDDQSAIDAVDNGTNINLADLVTFEDWRYAEPNSTQYEFSVKPIRNFDYFNYYGVKAINPNLDKAMTDLNGVKEPLKLYNGRSVYFKYFPYEAADGADVLPYADAADFITKMGYIYYQNISLNVSTFHIWLPVTIEYDWGETAPVEITITINRTEGQPIDHSRVK